MTTVKQVLAVAQGELGTAESPAGSNRTKYGLWYGLDGQPWCMMFVMWVLYMAGVKLPYKTASCSDLLRWYRTNRPACVVQTPAPGDIVIYSFGHTGLVESVKPGAITAIEGNTSPDSTGSQSNGGMVCRRTRKTSAVTAYIRPDRRKEDAHMDNIPSPAHREGVEWAVRNGILAGDASGDLGLGRDVTRQQLCTMLKRLADHLEKR